MNIFIENNNTKNGKKKRKKKKKSEIGLEPSTFGSTRLHLTTTPQAYYVTLGKRLQFNVFSIG